MSKISKFTGFALGITAATTMGVAMAQGVPPIAEVANEAMGAGQQSILGTPMGETGINEVAPYLPPERQAVPVVVVPVEQPQTVVVVPPQTETMGQAPAPVAQAAPEPAPIVTPEPVIVERPELPVRADRN